LNALVKATCECLGFQSIARDVGICVQVEELVDSSAAQSIVLRSGLGRTKHVEVKYCVLRVGSVPGDRNPEDVFTKPHSFKRFEEMCEPPVAGMCDCDHVGPSVG
jgi:hypothetical protein